MAFTSKASGEYTAAGQTTWNEVGIPTVLDDVAIATGHAITSAVAWEGQNITIAGTGSFVTAAAGTYTSITNNGTGALTIGAGTGGGVLVNASSGLMTINGNQTGITNFTPNNCTLGGNITMSGTLTGPAEGCTFAQNGYTVSGYNTTIASYSGAWTCSAGAILRANQAGMTGITIGATGSFVATGTSGSVVTIDNASANRGQVFVVSGTLSLSHVDLQGFISANAATAFIDCSYVEFDPRQASLNILTMGVVFSWLWFGVDHCWFAGVASTKVLAGTSGRTFGMGGPSNFSDWAVGYKRTGASNALTQAFGDDSIVSVDNILVNATTISGARSVITENNFGFVDPLMLPGTGTALDVAVVAAGAYETRTFQGVVGRSAASPYGAETYHLRETPGSSVLATAPLTAFCAIPVTTGDVVTVAGRVRRTTIASTTPATVRTDPEQAFSTAASTTPTLTDAGTWYDYTVDSGAVTGAGNMRIVLETTSYTAGGYNDFSGVTITVTHADASTTIYRVSFQYGANGMPVIDPPDYPALAEVLNTATFDFSLVGTYDASLYTLISGVAAAGDVRNLTPRYTGGPNGTWDAVSKTDVVSESWVVVGNNNYVGGSAGTYPTMATSQAAQLATDVAAVTVEQSSILNTATILGVTGTFNESSRNSDPGVANVWYPTAYKILNVSKAGSKRASSITNCAADNIKNGITIDDVTGTAALASAFTLKSSTQVITKR